MMYQVGQKITDSADREWTIRRLGSVPPPYPYWGASQVALLEHPEEGWLVQYLKGTDDKIHANPTHATEQGALFSFMLKHLNVAQSVLSRAQHRLVTLAAVCEHGVGWALNTPEGVGPTSPEGVGHNIPRSLRGLEMD